MLSMKYPFEFTKSIKKWVVIIYCRRIDTNLKIMGTQNLPTIEPLHDIFIPPKILCTEILPPLPLLKLVHVLSPVMKLIKTAPLFELMPIHDTVVKKIKHAKKAWSIEFVLFSAMGSSNIFFLFMNFIHSHGISCMESHKGYSIWVPRGLNG